MEFNKISNEFKTIKQMEIEKKKIKNDICDFFGVERKNIRLQNGLILLQGKYNETWQNISSVITDFPEQMKKELWTEFRLKTSVAVNSK